MPHMQMNDLPASRKLEDVVCPLAPCRPAAVPQCLLCVVDWSRQAELEMAFYCSTLMLQKTREKEKGGALARGGFS